MDQVANRLSRALALSDDEDVSAGHEELKEKDKKSSEPIYQVSSTRSSSASSHFRMDAEDSITGAGSPTLADDGGGNDDTRVVESKDRLVPACWQYHGIFKGKRKEGQLSGLSLAAQRCGGLDACKKTTITPTTESQSHYRLTTADPDSDLKRWVMTRNDIVFGEPQQRTITFIQGPRYSAATLLSTLDLAINEIQSENAHLDSLMDYVSREPYFESPPWGEGLDPAYLRMSISDFASVEGVELEHALMKAVVEFDFLRGRVAWACGKILGVKQAGAKRGEWVEIADLLRMGAVDEGWVQKECNV